MKLLFLLGFLALASAYPLESSEHDLVERDVDNFLSHEVFAEEQISIEEVKKRLKERLDEVLGKIKDAIDQGKAIKGDFLVKVKEIREKLKDLNVDLGEKGKELLEKIREKGREFLKKLLENLGKDKRNVDSEFALHAEEYGDIVSQLKDKFDEISKKVKDAFEQGKSLKEGLDQLQKIREKLKELNIDLGDKGNEFLNKLKEKVKDYWNKLLDRLTSKRSADIDVFGMLEQLKEAIKNHFDADKLKSLVEKYFGKGSEIAERFLSFLREKGEQRKQKLLDFIDRVLRNKEKRSVKEVFEKINDFFRDLNIELKEKFVKFGRYIKEEYEKGLEKGKTRVENLRKIAEEFIGDTRKISRDVAEEALDFFKEYKDDLGTIFENVRTKVKKILKEEA